MSSATPASIGGLEPSLAALSLSGGGGGAVPETLEVTLPVVGARVRCEGLTGAAELNGCLGRVVSNEGARARVRMDGPGGRVVGVKPQNLVVVVGRGLHSSTSQLNLSRFRHPKHPLNA